MYVIQGLVSKTTAVVAAPHAVPAAAITRTGTRRVVALGDTDAVARQMGNVLVAQLAAAAVGSGTIHKLVAPLGVVDVCLMEPASQF